MQYDISKHWVIYCDISIQTVKKQGYLYHKSFLNYKLVNYDELNHKLCECNLIDLINHAPNLHLAAQQWTDEFLNVCHQHIPLTTVWVGPKDKPWIATKIKLLTLVARQGYYYPFSDVIMEFPTL